MKRIYCVNHDYDGALCPWCRVDLLERELEVARLDYRRLVDLHVSDLLALGSARMSLKELIKECDQSVELYCVHSYETVERARKVLGGEKGEVGSRLVGVDAMEPSEEQICSDCGERGHSHCVYGLRV